MDHQYFVYGVTLASDMRLDLPAVVPATAGGPHVRFVRGSDDHFPDPSPQPPEEDRWFVCRELADDSLYFRWSDLYEFRVDPAGECVRYRPVGDTDPLVLQNFLFGQALSFALVRQQVEPVHAAIVDIGGEAIALLGDCTYGKSTLAAAFLAQGCRLVSDDVLVVDRRGGRPVAQAGTGRIKLHSDSARTVLRRLDGTPVMPGADKRAFRLDERMVQRTPVPLRAFVVLPAPDQRARCRRIDIESIGRARLFHELVKNTYVRHLANPRRLRQNFAWNAQIAGAVDGYALRYPPGISRLPLVADAVIDQVRCAYKETLHEDRKAKAAGSTEEGVRAASPDPVWELQGHRSG